MTKILVDSTEISLYSQIISKLIAVFTLLDFYVTDTGLFGLHVAQLAVIEHS